jgi:PKD repeat protein
MNDWLRSRARWLGAALIVVLAGVVAYMLRDGGSAHAQPGPRGIVQARAIAPALGSATSRSAGRARSQSAVSTSRPARATSAPRSGPRRGVPTPAPTRSGLSQSLRQATGLNPAQVTSRRVCGAPAPGHATCAAQALVLRASGALVRPHVSSYRSLGRVSRAVAQRAHPGAVAASAPPQADTPAYLQQAYDLTALSQSGGTGDTVAVVDAFDDPTAASDLSAFRSKYSLPACSASPCFRRVTQSGGTSSYPPANAAWDQEIALDLDAVSAVCPNCHILLVEANSDRFGDLQAAMRTAANLGANQISASWWGISSGVPAGFSTFSGIATVAATGDAGYAGPSQDNYPAALPGVTAAGGTSLAPASTLSARGFGESAWSWNGQDGGGSGCDLQFDRPSYQPAQGCEGRAYADLSADADPNTGLTVYNHGTWSLIGGTSLSTPLVAAYYAITGVAGATPEWAYADSGAFNDVLSGSTGTCAPSIAYICNAGAGYDGPTGVGSISGSVVVGAPGIGGPSVTTSGAGTNTYTAAVSEHGATIEAGIYRNGLDTTWSIQYGTTTSYGSQSSPIDIGAGAAPVAVTGYLSQLIPGTTYHYRLVATNSMGTTYGYDYTFTTQPAPAGAPVAAFAASPSTAAPGSQVTFDASTSTAGTGGSISDYSWNFGDGTTFDAQSSQTTQHAYATRGTYTVTLTITSNGQTDTSTQSVTIDAAPTASFTPSSGAVPDGATVAFNAGASTAGGGAAIIDYSWNFGDGTRSDAGAAPHTSHAFKTPGLYTVTLTTTDDLGVSSTASQQITVAPFTVSQATPNAPVTFTAVNSPSGSTLSWNFGDQTPPASGSPATHTYTTRGAYPVTLTVQGSSTTTSTTATVIVDSPPAPAFTPSATVLGPGTSVGFDASASTASGNGSIADYSWNFGDGSRAQDTGSGATTSHTFPTPGVYTVTLTTTDDLGASASTSEQITVDEPTAAFTTSQAGAVPSAVVSFDASATSDPESSISDYSWDFGDGTSADTGSTPSASHTYPNAGTYTVTLTVTDQLGLSDTATEQVVIAPASVQSTGAPPPVQPPVSTPAPTPPPSSPPVTTTPKPVSLVVKLSGARRQRLAQVLVHGIHLGLTVNRRTPAVFQITIPRAQTRQANGHTKGIVVLLRRAQTLGAGKQTIVLRLSRAAARRLALRGQLVVTVRVTVGGTAGTVTRTAKIVLTR